MFAGIEKEVRASVAASLKEALAGLPPPEEWMYEDIYADANGQSASQDFIRMPDYQKSIRA